MPGRIFSSMRDASDVGTISNKQLLERLRKIQNLTPGEKRTVPFPGQLMPFAGRGLGTGFNDVRNELMRELAKRQQRRKG